MSKIIKPANSRQPVEIKAANGFDFYRARFKKDWWVSGPEICRLFGVKNPNVRSSQIWSRYENNLSRNSCLIEIPTPIKKKNGTNPLSSTRSSQNVQLTRCYNLSGALFFTSKLNTKSSDDMISQLFDGFAKIMQPKTLGWQEARQLGKKQRQCLTDGIQLFVTYATGQGSGSPEMYYIHITKKINKLLFDIHGKGTPDNFRDSLSDQELAILGVAEERIADYLLSCMDIGMHYKDVYKTIDPILHNVRQVLDFKLSIPKITMATL